MLNKTIAWILQEVDSYRQHRRHQQTLFEMTELIADIVDPKIRLAKSYPKTLFPSVETAMAYCRSMVASIPGPVHLDQDRYYYDPLVKTIFSSAEEMETILRHARGIRLQLEGKEFVALLTMTKTEKTIFGHQQQGELFLRDVAMRTLTFSEHRMVALTDDLQTAKTHLEQRSFEVLAAMAKQKIAYLQSNLVELRENRERIAFMIRVLGGRTPLFERSAHEACKIRELEQMLTVIEKKIEQAIKELYPEYIINRLKQIIGAPEDSLFFCHYSVCVNWMNVIVENKEQNECNNIALFELTIDKDMQRRTAIFVRFD